MEVAFYKAKGTLFDAVIKFLTCPLRELFNDKWKSSYSHCELIFSDGIWFSASIRDGGVRFKYIVEQEGAWDFVKVSISREDEAWLRDWCTSQVGKKYDWLGVLVGQLTRLYEIQDPKRWYCSEIVSKALRRGYVPALKTDEVTPRELYDKLKS